MAEVTRETIKAIRQQMISGEREWAGDICITTLHNVQGRPYCHVLANTDVNTGYVLMFQSGRKEKHNTLDDVAKRIAAVWW